MQSENNVYYNISSIPGLLNLLDEENAEICETKILNKTISYTKRNQKYFVIRYDKNILSNDLISTYGLTRSIILNSNNKIVSFAPPKSINAEEFITCYPNLNSPGMVVEEFVEGTMINVFWDETVGLTGSWEIATRNVVGAESSFYKTFDSESCFKSKTFRDMFLEAASENNLIIDVLDKRFCYSFVLQHPENRIVVPFNRPQLYLVAVYEIIYFNEKTIYVSHLDMNFVKNNGSWHTTSIQFPKIYNNTSYSELIDTYASMNTPYNILGVVIKNVLTGQRCKIRNPNYEQVRLLRGNQPKLQYQYLCLRKEGKVGDFLKYYPEEKKMFSSFRDQLHLFTRTLYQNYISCYIKKEKPLLEFPKEYRSHMYQIHQKYLNELREKKLHVTNTVVINYVNSMQPAHILYWLNHNVRQRHIDLLNADTNF